MIKKFVKTVADHKRDLMSGEIAIIKRADTF